MSKYFQNMFGYDLKGIITSSFSKTDAYVLIALYRDPASRI